MFVRKKKNRSGSVSVQVIDKSKDYRVVKTIGSSKNPEQISRMFELAKLFIDHQNKQYSLFPRDQQDNAAVLDFVRNVQNSHVRTVGPELIFGKIFDQIGFDAIPERLFRDIVIARLVYPTSKANCGMWRRLFESPRRTFGFVRCIIIAGDGSRLMC